MQSFEPSRARIKIGIGSFAVLILNEWGGNESWITWSKARSRLHAKPAAK